MNASCRAGVNSDTVTPGKKSDHLARLKRLFSALALCLACCS
ncbi:MAG: hypothetical protein ACE5FN_09130 [Leptospirillia bacterium]